jgi:hypothetical protein
MHGEARRGELHGGRRGVECVGGWVDVCVAVFEGVLRMAFGASVSVVVFGEWASDVMVEELALREIRGLREAFVWALMS